MIINNLHSHPHGVRHQNLFATEEGTLPLPLAINCEGLLENGSMKRARERIEYYGGRWL